MATSPVDKKLFKELAEVLNANELTEIEYDTDNFRIRLAKNPAGGMVMAAPAYAPTATAFPTASPAVAATPAATTATEVNWDAHEGAIKSPMVGVLYAAPDPNSPPYIQEGDAIKAGQTLFLIEAMKTFNPVKSPRAGKVLKILVKNAQPVEFDETLVVIG